MRQAMTESRSDEFFWNFEYDIAIVITKHNDWQLDRRLVFDQIVLICPSFFNKQEMLVALHCELCEWKSPMVLEHVLLASFSHFECPPFDLLHSVLDRAAFASFVSAVLLLTDLDGFSRTTPEIQSASVLDFSIVAVSCCVSGRKRIVYGGGDTACQSVQNNYVFEEDFC
jgi:hypothetical protein